MISMDNYYDDHGYLTLSNYDGGDSSQMTGFYRYMRWIKCPTTRDRDAAKFNQELDGFEMPRQPGVYRRHPDPERRSVGSWWADPAKFSRDQQRAITMSMGAFKLKSRLYRITWNLIKRCGFYQNKDVSSPENWAEIFRSFWQAGCYWALFTYPLILLGDAWKIVNILLSWLSWKKNPDDADDDNLIQSVLQAKFSLPTPLSWLARKLYVKIRPTAGYLDATKTISLREAPVIENIPGPDSALKWKHRQNTGSPPLYEYSKEILEKHLR